MEWRRANPSVNQKQPNLNLQSLICSTALPLEETGQSPLNLREQTWLPLDAFALGYRCSQSVCHHQNESDKTDP